METTKLWSLFILLAILVTAGHGRQTEFQYKGCYLHANWDRSRTRDVAQTVEGVKQCRQYCKSAGQKYFGMECPMGNRGVVHCECTNDLGKGYRVHDQRCRQFNWHQRGNHCNGRFEVGGYLLGAAYINSAYEVEPVAKKTHTFVPFASLGTFGNSPLSDEAANKAIRGLDAETKIVRRLCPNCASTHREIYYKRLPNARSDANFNYADTFKNNWFSANNEFHRDFELYSTLEDALQNRNAWRFCNFNDPSVGFPRDCDPVRFKAYQWNSFAGRHSTNPHRQKNVQFSYYGTLKSYKYIPFASLGSFGNSPMSDEAANKAIRALDAETKIVRRVCPNCASTHREIYYKRLPTARSDANFNYANTFKSKWFSANNEFHRDFELYSTLDDALKNKNTWKFCNFNDPSVGFPRDCGPNGYIPFQWNSFAGRHSTHARRQRNVEFSYLAQCHYVQSPNMCIHGYNLSTHNKQTLSECSNLCDGRKDCVSFDWRKMSYGYNCALQGVTSSKVGGAYTDCTNAGWSYFEKSCEAAKTNSLYKIKNNGPRCSSIGMQDITNVQECKAAVESLGLYQHPIHAGHWGHAPYGCFQGHPRDGWRYTYFNTRVGATGNSAYRTICKQK